MTVQSVMERFRLLSGLSTQEASQWSALAEDACAQIAARMRADVETEENTRLLEAAAAALVYYEYRTAEGAKREVTSFKAGDLSLEFAASSGSNDAYGIYIRALEACSKLLDSGEFIFGRVGSLCTES